jgi:SOS-response transcriptional repressor LexA
MTEAAMLSRREADVLAAVMEAIRLTGRPPTVREIAGMTGISSTSVVSSCVDHLEAAGRVRRTPELARGIWPVVDGGTCPVCRGSGRWECEG